MVEWMSYPLYYAFDGAAPPPRAGAAHATIYPYGPFPAGDGKIVMLGLAERARMGGVLRARCCATARARDRRALRVELAAHARRAGGFARSSSTPFAPLTAAEVERAARRRADRECADERHAGSAGASRSSAARKRWAEVGLAGGPGARAHAARRCRTT